LHLPGDLLQVHFPPGDCGHFIIGQLGQEGRGASLDFLPGRFRPLLVLDNEGERRAVAAPNPVRNAFNPSNVLVSVFMLRSSRQG
jgi:hypothetical protein